MTKLEELINELCPDGVEYKKLGDIGKVSMCKRILKSQTSSEGDVPFYKIGTFGNTADSFISNKLFNEYKEKYSYPQKGDILISCSGTIGRTVIFDGKPAYFQDSNIVWLEHNKTKVTNKYLYYCYQLKPWSVATGGTIARLYNDNILKAKIPVPPIKVQEEIVRILDNFTELTAELTAELDARQKQYSYYRDYLLSFDNEHSLADDIESVNIKTVERIKLEDVCEVYDGTHQTPNYKDSGVKFVSVENIKNLYETKKYISQSDFEKYKIKPQINDVLMTRIGDIGTPAIVKSNEPLAYYVSLALLRPNTKLITTEYLYHYIGSKFFKRELNKHTIHTAVPIKINKNEIGKCFINIPSIETQNKIVSILDRFDELCNGISEGLPAEIEARKKQYEYYRDALLSFDEKTCSQIVKVERERELSRSKSLKWAELGDILKIKNGKDYKAYGDGNIPVYGSGGIMTYIDTYAYDKPSVLIPRKGSIDKLYYVDIPFWTVDTIFYTEINTNIVLAKYVYYWLKKEHLERLNTAGGVPSLTQAVLNRVKIAIPPIEEQERIVSILDRFDKLCNDISEGLPAEINARQKQYEYYRDKLLTFKEKTS